MKQPPFMFVHVAETLAETAELTATEFGVLTRLLYHSWVRDGLPNDIKKLGAMAGGKPTESVMRWLKPDAVGLLRNDAVEAMRVKAAGNSQAQAARVAKRWAKRDSGRKADTGVMPGLYHGNTVTQVSGNTSEIETETEIKTQTQTSDNPPITNVMVPPTGSSGHNGHEQPKAKRVGFVRPTVDEVRAYITEINAGVNAETFIDYYEAKGWKIGASLMKDWKAAVRNWERKRLERQGLDPSKPAPKEVLMVATDDRWPEKPPAADIPLDQLPL